MRNRRPKQGHDAITGELVNRPFIVMHLAGQDVKTTVHDRMYTLGVYLFGERAKTGDIGKDDGDLLPFPFQGTAGGQNFVSQVPGGKVSGSRSLGMYGEETGEIDGKEVSSDSEPPIHASSPRVDWPWWLNPGGLSYQYTPSRSMHYPFWAFSRARSAYATRSVRWCSATQRRIRA